MKDGELYEEWRYITNFPEYMVSTYGEVRKTGSNRGRRLKMRMDVDGSIYFHLPGDNEPYKTRVDRAVAMAFLGIPDKYFKKKVIHLDGDQTNCRVDNLKWEDG